MGLIFMLIGICLWLMPGFLITFFVGFVLRKNGRPSVGTIVGASFIGGIVMALVLGMWMLHELGTPEITDHFSKALTVDEARKVFYNIPFPDTARSIQIGTASEFHGYEYLVRFEAPIQDCKDELHRATESYSGQPPVWQHLIERPTPVGRRYSNSNFDDPSWFDVQSIVHGETARDGPDTFWVDEDRGVFYYQRLK